MKICLIGDFRRNLDEGFSNISFNLASELAKHHKIMKVDIWRPSFSDWARIRKEKPDIIHFFTIPSIASFWILKVLGSCGRGSKTVISALHPGALILKNKIIFKKIFFLLKPDLILVQLSEIGQMFVDFGCKVRFLMNGVDTKRFSTSSGEIKKKLRRKYGVDPTKFVILHVGHLKRKRNLQIFNRIQGGNNQVLIVASTYRKEDKHLHQELAESGCIVWRRYFANIEEIYNLADCYLFPTQRDNCLLVPLSVLEAMSCNLPVISTKFQVLTRIFPEGDGLYFVEKEKDFIYCLENLKANNEEVTTRGKVLSYSWDNIAMELDKIYKELISCFSKDL